MSVFDSFSLNKINTNYEILKSRWNKVIYLLLLYYDNKKRPIFVKFHWVKISWDRCKTTFFYHPCISSIFSHMSTQWEQIKFPDKSQNSCGTWILYWGKCIENCRGHCDRMSCQKVAAFECLIPFYADI